jgi:predicted nucleotide-binding protein (sugar kinase/HSP70/actin superfamily)
LYDSIQVDNSKQKKVIAISGDPASRFLPFLNHNMFQILEENDIEIWNAAMSTSWICNTVQYYNSELLKNKRYFNYLLFNFYHTKKLYSKINRFVSVFSDFLRHYENFDFKKFLNYSKPYSNSYTLPQCNFIWYVSETIEFINQKADGVILINPLTCMNGNVHYSLLNKIKKDYDIPTLIVSIDGLESTRTNLKTRLEAFAYQVKKNS